MINKNLVKWKLKLIASKRRVLITHLVAEASNLFLFDDATHIGCFRQTRLLMDYTKSSSNDDIKPRTWSFIDSKNSVTLCQRHMSN